MVSLAFLFSLLAVTNAASMISRQDTVACNNSPDLCSKSYSAITHLGAHDSPFVRDASTGFSTSGNQYFNSTVQLDAGVRLLSAQVHDNNGGFHLCHSSCDLLDAGTLSSWLGEIKKWLDNNANEVVTILLVNSDNMTPSELHKEFTAAEITDYAYKPASTSTAPQYWPTLQELIDAKTRLMVFVASLDPASISGDMSYLMDEFTFLFENSFENIDPANFSCEPDRPTAFKGQSANAIGSFRMPLMNHFLYEQGLFSIETPNVDDIGITNSPSTSTVGNLGQSLQSCTSAYGRPPTFVLVDFFDEGPAIQAVDNTNGVTNPVGRKKLPARDTESDVDRKTSTFSGVQKLVAQYNKGEKIKKGAWIWAAGDWSWGGLNVDGGSLVS